MVGRDNMIIDHHEKVGFTKDCDAKSPGGGLPKIWSSMLKQNLVWNGGGGSKIEKNCTCPYHV